LKESRNRYASAYYYKNNSATWEAELSQVWGQLKNKKDILKNDFGRLNQNLIIKIKIDC
jgi:hypothetical protein